MIGRYLTDDVLTRVRRLRPLADEAGLSMAQLAVAWVLQNSNVSAAIVGATRREQVVENAGAAGIKLDAELSGASTTSSIPWSNATWPRPSVPSGVAERRRPGYSAGCRLIDA